MFESVVNDWIFIFFDPQLCVPQLWFETQMANETTDFKASSGVSVSHGEGVNTFCVGLQPINLTE